MHTEILSAICESTDDRQFATTVIQIYETCFPDAKPICEGLLSKLAKGAAIGSLALGLSHAAPATGANAADFGARVSEIAHDNTLSYIADNIRGGHITTALDIMAEMNKSTLNGEEAKRYKKYENFIATKYPSILVNHQINQRLSKIEDYVDNSGLSVDIDKVTRALTKFTAYQKKLMAPETTKRIKMIYQKAKDNHYKASWCKENSVSLSTTRTTGSEGGTFSARSYRPYSGEGYPDSHKNTRGSYDGTSYGSSTTTQIHLDPRNCTQMAQDRMNELESHIMDDMDKLETAPASPRTVRRAKALYDKYNAEFDDLKRKGATPTYPNWRTEWFTMMDTITTN